MKDKKLHYFWGSWKNPSFRGGFHKKTIYRGGDCLKMEARTVCRFNGGAWQERKGDVFEREGLVPQCTLSVYMENSRTKNVTLNTFNTNRTLLGKLSSPMVNSESLLRGHSHQSCH